MDDFPSFGTVVKWVLGTLGCLVVFSMLLWGLGIVGKVVTKPIDTAVGIMDRVIDPDHALQTYRWFHESYQQVQAKTGQIGLAKSALEAANTDRKEARRVELLGLQQSCQTLVSEYNAKATRADTVIFQHPERFLPGTWPGDRSPLPSQLNLASCS